MTSLRRGILTVVCTSALLPLPAAAGIFDCPGDCNADRAVTVDEIVTAVNIALGELTADACRNADSGGDGQVTVDELLAAVTAALEGCGDPGILAAGIRFVPASSDVGGDRSLLFRLGDELVFNDGSDEPLKAVHLATRRTRPLVRQMGVPAGLAVAGADVFWSERRNGIAPSGCAGPGVVGVVNRTSIAQRTTVTLASGDHCSDATGDVVVAAGSVFHVAARVSPPEYDIRSIPAAGGSVTTLLTTPRAIVRLAADATHLYWMESDTGPEADTAIRRRPLAGGAVELVLGGLGMLVQSQGGFAVAAGFVYAALPAVPGPWDLVRVPASGGTPTVLATLAAAPVGYAVVGDRLFWGDATAIRAIPLGGGAVQTLADGLASPVALAALADGVAWTEGVCCAHGQGGRVQRTRGDDSVVVLADGIDDPVPIAAGGGQVVWGEGGPIGLIEGFGRVAAAPAAGGPATTLAAGCSATLPDMTANGEDVFYVDRFRVERVDLAGGPPATVVADDFFVGSIAADATNLYRMTQPFSGIVAAPLAGGAETLVATADSLGKGLRVTATHVYWGEGLTAIRRVPLAGGAQELLAVDLDSDAGFANGVFADDEAVFWAEVGAGTIRALPR